MKRFLTSVCLFSVLLVGLMAFSLFVLPDNRIINSMLGAQRLKLDLLDKKDGPRIIFVAGSNVGHGFDSTAVEKAFGRPVMNMGLHAGLGLIYHVRSIEDHVREGDVIVVCPEYSMFTGDCWGDEELLAMVSAIIPEHRALLSFEHYMHLADKAPRYACRKLWRLGTLFEPIKGKTGYTSSGDQAGPHSAERLPFPSGTKTIGPEAYTEEVLPYLNDFIASCGKMGAKVYLMPPVLERTSFEHMRGLIAKIGSKLKRNNTPFITPPENFVFDDDLFHDTQYHLNARGIPLRMQEVVKALNQAILR